MPDKVINNRVFIPFTCKFYVFRENLFLNLISFNEQITVNNKIGR